MLDAKQVIAKMNERGFTETMHMCSGGATTCITFMTMRLDGTDISCTVNLEEETFAFMWGVPCSINRLSTPPCSPVLDDNQFNRIYRKILKHVRLLYTELEREGDVPCLN
jgi:hypothetical protein